MFVARDVRGARERETVPAVVGDVAREPGVALDSATRSAMESRFERSFAGVRIHDGDRAARAATAIDAAAYTIGDHIVFGPQARPGSNERRDFLAHELAHVAQAAPQHARGIASELTLASTNDPAEREAERLASAVARGGRVGPSMRVASNRVHRAVLPEVESSKSKSVSKSYATTVPISKSEVAPRLAVPSERSGLEPVNPAPKLAPQPALDEFFPRRPEPKSLFDITPPEPKSQPPSNPAPKDSDPKPPPAPTPAPAQAPDPAAKETDGPGGAVQFGRGTQVAPGIADSQVDYTQVTLQLRDFYLVPIDTLPSWLKELKFLGEPAAQLQYHLGGAAPKTLDAQIVFNVVQASFDVFKHKLDVSVVSGAMLADIANLKKKTAGQSFSPIPGGLDAEYNLVVRPHLKINIDLQGLVADQYLPDPKKPGGSRKPVVQGSAELRFVIEF